jgi:hypothetical protein
MIGRGHRTAGGRRDRNSIRAVDRGGRDGSARPS